MKGTNGAVLQADGGPYSVASQRIESRWQRVPCGIVRGKGWSASDALDKARERSGCASGGMRRVAHVPLWRRAGPEERDVRVLVHVRQQGEFEAQD